MAVVAVSAAAALLYADKEGCAAARVPGSLAHDVVAPHDLLLGAAVQPCTLMSFPSLAQPLPSLPHAEWLLLSAWSVRDELAWFVLLYVLLLLL